MMTKWSWLWKLSCIQTVLGYLWWTFKTSFVDDDCRKKPVTVYFCRAIKQTEIRIKAGDWIGKVEPQQKSASVKLQPKYMTAVSARVYVRAHARVPSILLALFFAEPQPPGVLKSIKSNTRLLWCVCVCVCVLSINLIDYLWLCWFWIYSHECKGDTQSIITIWIWVSREWIRAWTVLRADVFLSQQLHL